MTHNEDAQPGDQTPNEGDVFISELVPSMVMAVAASKVASLLDNPNPARFDAELRNGLINSLLRDLDPPLSRQGRDSLRRSTQRIAQNPSHMSWTSLPVVGATISISSWQSATEIALRSGGRYVCSSTAPSGCEHDPRGFRKLWDHFIARLKLFDSDLADEVARAYADAKPLIELRNRLIHGQLGESDEETIAGSDLGTLTDPLTRLHAAIVHAALHVGFDEPEPALVLAQGIFKSLGLPQSVLEEIAQREPRPDSPA